MLRIQSNLEKEGYTVYNYGYPSTKDNIQTHAQNLRKWIETNNNYTKIHFVTHSLGSLIVRYMLVHYPIPNPGRFVMIAPPNQGSEIASMFNRIKAFSWITGETGQQLLAGEKSFVETIGIPDVEFGIIAGGLGNEKGFNPLLEGDDDGTLRVEETYLEGASDFIVLPYTHTPILFFNKTINQTLYFLKNGKFYHEKTEGGG
jgi:pimeloyl-ACP methyl ester carboxylesterase